MPPLKNRKSVLRTTLSATALVATLVALAALVALPTGAPRTSTSDAKLASSSGYPTNAGKIFRWGRDQFGDEFIGGLKGMWDVNKPRHVRNQNGMLTLSAGPRTGTVSATMTGHARKVGRWEARVRANQHASGHGRYRVVWELIPVGAYNCGSRSIQLANYQFGNKRAHMAIHNGSKMFLASKARNLGAGPFHTYAVEVTKTHISWFVDTHVIMTERRPAALSGARFKIRFRLLAPAGARMNDARMQMDWVRYYTLARPNAKSIKAPQARMATYSQAC